jgi:toxin YoeB
MYVLSDGKTLLSHREGKPEPLRHQFKGCWSRRIDQEHRLVYRVTDEAITILSCRDHY